MPQIGDINVPDTLWEALVERSSRDFTQLAFDIAKAQSDLDLTDPLYDLRLEASELAIPYMHNCVVALVRMKTGDFTSDDMTIKKGNDYHQVLDAARLEGDQLAYATLLSKKQGSAIKNILDSNWPTRLTKLPPQS